MEKNNLRYERKFFITAFTKSDVESLIRFHPAVFSEIYHERTVNNIYMDSFDMGHYLDNVIGLEKRMKVRIRWYGDIFGRIENPNLELKSKNGFVCRKTSFSLPAFDLDGDFSIRKIHDTIKDSVIPDRMKLDLGCLEASLLNSYRRRYYLSADGRYRVTVDSDMEFRRIMPFENSFLERSVDYTSVILEAKYDEDSDGGAEKVTSYFPFRMTKSSKYIMGIERLNL